MKKLLFVALVTLMGVKVNAQSVLTIDMSSDCDAEVTIYVWDPASGCSTIYSSHLTIHGGTVTHAVYPLSSLTWTGLATPPLPPSFIIDHINVSQSGTSCVPMTVGFTDPCGVYPTSLLLPSCSCTTYSINLTGMPNNADLNIQEL